ncbi:MAG: hypothetical protein Q8J92_07625 [Parvibaculum sp.]|nr:hypothetical protein [Parvibaculum sp.]
MALWTRWLITLAAMLIASVAAGYLWNGMFNADIPSYLSGLVGGAAAVPVWELLKRMDGPAAG